jgi:hypothetical protein
MKMLKLWEKLGENILKLLIPCILINLFYFTNRNKCTYKDTQQYSILSIKHVAALLCHPQGVLTPSIKTS